MRLQTHLRQHRRTRRFVVGVLSLPALIGLYAHVVARQLRTGRPAILVVLMSVGLAASLATDPLIAARQSAHQAIRPEAYAPATMPAPAIPGSAASDNIANAVGSTDGKRAVRRAYIPLPDAPGVVRFRPRAGQTGISSLAALSVRFTVPMDPVSTQRAFSATVGGSAIAGSYRWAEADTVLVLQPAHSMPFGARVTLSVASDARSAAGVSLPEEATAGFTVAPKPPPASPRPAPTSASATSGWRWPLIGPITQYFGQTLTKYGVHQGIDIDGQTGDPVRAARSGRVIVAGHYDDCGGLEVHIDHGGGLVSWYRHLSRIDVRVGESVAAGTIIALVGETGCALGSHLHFAIRRGTTFVDPLPYLPKR